MFNATSIESKHFSFNWDNIFLIHHRSHQFKCEFKRSHCSCTDRNHLDHTHIYHLTMSKQIYPNNVNQFQFMTKKKAKKKKTRERLWHKISIKKSMMRVYFLSFLLLEISVVESLKNIPPSDYLLSSLVKPFYVYNSGNSSDYEDQYV